MSSPRTSAAVHPGNGAPQQQQQQQQADPLDGLQLFVARHGERVDNCFGSDWLDKCFTINHSQKYSTYKRINLNMPKDMPSRLPRRPLEDFDEDTPITELGWWQAANVGEALSGARIANVFCSPALRCVQTATSMVNAMGLGERFDFAGICVEPALFEWTGWQPDVLPNWLSPQQLKASGLRVNADYKPISSLPLPNETQKEWYLRSTNLAKKLVEKYGAQGNILCVAHMGSLDCVTYGLLTGESSPSEPSIEMGARYGLTSNFCGVARIRRSNGKWAVRDDQQLQQTNLRNEPFSFYEGWKSLSRRASPSSKQRRSTDTALPALEDLSSKQANRIHDLHFRRIFGFLLDSAGYVTKKLQQEYKQRHNTVERNTLEELTRGELKHIEGRLTTLLPEWQAMANWHNGFTARHTYRCFITVNLILGVASTDRELYQLSAVDRNTFSWALLLHDLGKEVRLHRDGWIIRDSAHPFKSALIAARVLARCGFAHRDQNTKQFDELEKTIQKAIVPVEGLTQASADDIGRSLHIHDNTQLPTILQQIDGIFGNGTAIATIVKLVLLHQSIDFLPQYPPGNALDDKQILQLIDAKLLHLLRLLTQVDSASYTMTDMHTTNQNMQIIKDNELRLAKLMQSQGKK